MSAEKINIALIGKPHAVEAVVRAINHFAKQEKSSTPTLPTVLKDFSFKNVLFNIEVVTEEEADKKKGLFDQVLFIVVCNELSYTDSEVKVSNKKGDAEIIHLSNESIPPHWTKKLIQIRHSILLFYMISSEIKDFEDKDILSSNHQKISETLEEAITLKKHLNSMTPANNLGPNKVAVTKPTLLGENQLADTSTSQHTPIPMPAEKINIALIGKPDANDNNLEEAITLKKHLNRMTPANNLGPNKVAVTKPTLLGENQLADTSTSQHTPIPMFAEKINIALIPANNLGPNKVAVTKPTLLGENQLADTSTSQHTPIPMSAEKINIALIGKVDALVATIRAINHFAKQEKSSTPTLPTVLKDFLFEDMLVNVEVVTEAQADEKTDGFDGVIYADRKLGEPPQKSPLTPPAEYPNERFQDKCLRQIKEAMSTEVTEQNQFIVIERFKDPLFRLANKIGGRGDRLSFLSLYLEGPTESENFSEKNKERNDNNDETIRGIFKELIRVKRFLAKNYSPEINKNKQQTSIVTTYLKKEALNVFHFLAHPGNYVLGMLMTAGVGLLISAGIVTGSLATVIAVAMGFGAASLIALPIFAAIKATEDKKKLWKINATNVSWLDWLLGKKIPKKPLLTAPEEIKERLDYKEKSFDGLMIRLFKLAGERRAQTVIAVLGIAASTTLLILTLGYFLFPVLFAGTAVVGAFGFMAPIFTFLTGAFSAGFAGLGLGALPAAAAAIAGTLLVITPLSVVDSVNRAVRVDLEDGEANGTFIDANLFERTAQRIRAASARVSAVGKRIRVVSKEFHTFSDQSKHEFIAIISTINKNKDNDAFKTKKDTPQKLHDLLANYQKECETFGKTLTDIFEAFDNLEQALTNLEESSTNPTNLDENLTNFEKTCSNFEKQCTTFETLFTNVKTLTTDLKSELNNLCGTNMDDPTHNKTQLPTLN